MKKFDWDDFLIRHRDHIVEQWQKRLRSQVSEHYARRSVDELTMTTKKACDAFSQVLARDDYDPINAFISEITEIRLDAGFPLADVQKAFELYRQIVIPILIDESPADALCDNIQSVNRGLAYTIHRFSNHFQSVHETYLKEYAKRLEQDVAKRTAELKASEEQYKSLVNEISDGYLVLHNETISLVNPAFCQMHGVELEDALQQPFLDYVAKESRTNVRQMILKEMMDEAEPGAFEYLRQKKDGTCLPTEINIQPSRFRGQEYHLCILRDITKRVEMEKKSRELERMAYIGKLTASLSHEIRNPLSSVKMNLQILGKNNVFHGNDKKRLDISEREIQRLEGILQELLDFAKPVALQPAKTNINQVIFSCAELLEVKISKQHVDCSLNLDNQLPDAIVDQGKVEQVIINLLLNALESVESHGKISIATRCSDLDGLDAVVIRVEDDGKGVSKEMVAQIYEPFFTTKTTGTGLGLANVKRIVAAHKGRVDVVDLESAGTAFEVTLPLGEDDA